MNKNTTKILSIIGIILLLAIVIVLVVTNSSAKKADVASSASKEFTFICVDADGNEKTFNLSSDKTTVGEALLEEGLIAGEDSSYGLYVKEVDGITADYDKDGTYWAFYIDGEYASTGVDSTELEAGHTYSFKVEK